MPSRHEHRKRLWRIAPSIDAARPRAAALLRLSPAHPHRQRQPDAMAGHGVTAIEVCEHQGSRICVRHDHLGNQRREDRQEGRVRQGPRDGGNLNGQGVERDAQPVQPERRLIDHRARTEKSPVQARAAQSLEVDLVGPVGGLHAGRSTLYVLLSISIIFSLTCYRLFSAVVRSTLDEPVVSGRRSSPSAFAVSIVLLSFLFVFFYALLLRLFLLVLFLLFSSFFFCFWGFFSVLRPCGLFFSGFYFFFLLQFLFFFGSIFFSIPRADRRRDARTSRCRGAPRPRAASRPAAPPREGGPRR